MKLSVMWENIINYYLVIHNYGLLYLQLFLFNYFLIFLVGIKKMQMGKINLNSTNLIRRKNTKVLNRQ